MEQINCIVGLDIGGTNICIGAVDFNTDVLAFQKVNQHKVFDGTDILSPLLNFINPFIDENKLNGAKMMRRKES